MKEPSFFCIGFQKSGTTTLFEILKQHKGIALCRDVKEPMYYRVQGLRSIGGKRYYLWRYFGHLLPEDPRIVGEVNAGLSFTGCAGKISRDFAPDAKLIFMLRNPVERAYSAYKYFLARGFLPARVMRDDAEHGHALAFEHYVHAALDNPALEKQIMKKRLKYLVLSQSMYGACIQEYLDRFPKEHIKIIFFEDFIRDQAASCRQIYQFLGIEDDPAVDYGVRANEGSERPVSPGKAKRVMTVKGLRFVLYEFFFMSHWAPKLYDRFQNHYLRVRGKGLEPDPDMSKILPETRTYLEDYFRNDVRKVEAMTGRDLKDLWFA